MGGGVAATRVVGAHRIGLHPLLAKQGVGQRGFAGTGRTDQHHRAARAQPGLQHGDAVGIQAVDRMQRDALHLQFFQHRQCVFAVFGLVGLGQHHHRFGTTAANQQQVAFDTARIEVGVQAADDEHRIDVGRDHLLVVMLAGRTALDRAAPSRPRPAAHGWGSAGAAIPAATRP
ncbi:hypothetical protein G6F59_015272 [Rhizopus arrhizus]|nr:hypothetical protein G6F59_015272 [Rhizopus arrhizus]